MLFQSGKFFFYVVALLFVVSCNVKQSDLEQLSGQQDLIKEILKPAPLIISPNFKQAFVNTETTFTAQGGTEPYTFSKVSGPGTLDATGHYLAPSSPGDAVVRVTDSKGSTADALITINQELALTPTTKKMNVSTSFQFSASGGNAPYTYSIVSGGGSINTTGVFTAPGVAGQTILRVSDNHGVIANATVDVGNGPIISPTTKKMAVSKTFNFSVSSGTASLVWSVTQGGGSINGAGVFTSPATQGASTVRVTDALGYSSEATIESFVPNQITTGIYNSCVLRGNTGDVKCWGFAQVGSLGHYAGTLIGDHPSQMGNNLRPAMIGMGTGSGQGGLNPIDVAAGTISACATFDDGTAKCWGYSGYGANGYSGAGGNLDAYSVGENINFVPIGASRSIVQMEGGHYFHCALLDNGSVKCWGYWANGALGQDIAINYGIDQGGSSLYSMPPVALGTTATKVTAGYYHACALLTGGAVKCWGYNAYGQLGQNNTTTIGTGGGSMAGMIAVNLGGHAATDISAGAYYTCAVLDTGKARCWGYNYYGNLGTGDTVNYGSDNAAASVANVPEISFAGRSIVKIQASGYHTCALLDNGTLRCWGYNYAGQLGYGDTVNRGGAPGQMSTLTAVPLGTGRTVVSMGLGDSHTCAILDNNTLKCWGYNTWGNLGLGHRNNVGVNMSEMGDNLPAVNLGTNTIPLKVAKTMGSNTCILAQRDSQNVIFCLGQDLYGEDATMRFSVGIRNSDMGSNLAITDLGNADGPVTKISQAGVYGFCGIFGNGNAKCWGYNTATWMLLGSNSSQDYVGDTYGEMGNSLPYVKAGIGVKVLQTSGGKYTASSTCGLFDNAGTIEAKCWGYNYHGNGGQDTTNNMAYPYIATIPPINLGVGRYATKIVSGEYSACALLDNSTVKCWGWGAYGTLGNGGTADKGTGAGDMAALAPISLGTGITPVDICLGYISPCVLFDNGKVKCWGYNGNGELGLEDTNHRGDNPGEMGDSLPFINFGTGRTVKKIACGTDHNCAILDNDKLKCWGYNAYGQLGLGTTAYKGNTGSTMGNALPYVDLGTGRTAVDVAPANTHTCALLDNNDVKCWGQNQYGQLGLGHAEIIGNEPGEMGDNLEPVKFE